MARKESFRHLWRVLEFADWRKMSSPPIRQAIRDTGQIMGCVFKPEVIKNAEAFYKEKLVEIATVLENHAEAMCGNRHGYYGISDDSFWDLRAHIIGLGEHFYNSVVVNPEIAKKMADDRSYKENFGYIFNHTTGMVLVLEYT